MHKDIYFSCCFFDSQLFYPFVILGLSASCQTGHFLLKQIPDLEAKEFIAGIDSIKGSNGKRHATLFCYMVLSSSKTAKRAYDGLVEHYTDHDGKNSTGKSGGYTYTIEHSESETGTGGCTGIYLQGNTVIYIRGLATAGDSYELADKFCEKLGIISPSKA